MTKDLIVKRSLLINADKATVWDALINPEKTRQYMFNCAVISEWEPGGPILWRGNFEGYEAFQKGVIMQFEPGRKLQYSTFDPNFGLADHPDNYVYVTYELAEKGNQTELLTRIENFGGNEQRCENTAAGWDQIVIPRLKAMLEKKN